MSLLHDLWASEGWYGIVRINPAWKEKGYGTTSHRWFDDRDEAVDFALNGKHGKGTSVYFACSVYAEKGPRTQTNVAVSHAFWLDIDVGKKPSQPQTKKEAMALIGKLIETYSMPKPWYIIDSGLGLHIYWRTTPKAPKEWRQQATTLGRWCLDVGLDADPSRTTDCASVLRIPGTTHLKTGREVVVKYHNPDAEYLELPLSIVPSNERSEWDVVEVGHAPADHIIQACAQMYAIHDAGGDVEEPLRYAALQLLRHTDWTDTRDYEDLFHGVTHYDPSEEVPRKLHQLESRNVGPTTCATFEKHNPGGCEGCPFKGKVASPIVLERIVTEEPSDFEYAQDAPAAEVPAFSKIGRFSITDMGVSYLPEGDDEQLQMILTTPLRIAYLGRVTSSGAIAMLTWRSPKGVMHECEMPMVALADKREIARVLLKNLIPYAMGKEPLIMLYLNQYAAQMQQTAEPEVIARHFGWTDDQTFVVGDEAITVDGTTKTRLTATVSHQLIDAMTPRGDLARWSESTRHYADESLQPQGFALLSALAAPLLKLMNVQGAVLSLAGPSGTGKTTAVRHAMSVFGSPGSTLLSGRPTINAQIDMMRTACNIAVGMDDVTVGRMRELQDMVYMAANGQSRERSNRDGTMRERDTWATVLMVSTNHPLLKMPEAVSEAERRRVIELSVNATNRMHRDVGLDINNVIADNYGLAGRAYLRLLIKNREKVLALAEKYRQVMWDGIPDEYRFGVWLCAAALAGGTLAYKQGLIMFDPRPCVDAALRTLNHQASLEPEPVESIEVLITEYLRDNAGALTHKRQRKFDFTELNNRKVAGTINHDRQMIYIPLRKIEKYVRDNGGSMVSFESWRAEKNIQSRRELVVPTNKGGRTEVCIAIPHNPEEGDDYGESTDTDS